MFHEDYWELACENSWHSGGRFNVRADTWRLTLRVTFCERDWQPSCEVLLQKACLPQDMTLLEMAVQMAGKHCYQRGGWHALAWEDFVWSLLSPPSTESTGADKSHSTSPSNEVSAPLMGKLCAQREDVTGSHRERIELQRRKNSQLGLIHQVIYIKILMKLFDLLQRSIPV